ncbi:MAG: hypothetical protein LC795_04670 [Acidobacteria bacterium]|nr:hypothetical protein [Acidobacteriota bacterium]MCA1618602.1 hypothetical protein [Acidobacteriota bacterium]
MPNAHAPETPFWWPLDLSSREEEALGRFRRRMRETPVPLDAGLCAAFAEQLAELMSRHVAGIVERDSLPHLSHVLNGWGDARFRGRRVTERFENFIHRDAGARPFVLQCNPEGEFHPWQSFAYAVMAGVDPEESFPPGVTLRELMRNSRLLDTSEGRELGHLLFALAYVEPDAGSPPFSLRGECRDVRGLMKLAVEAHHSGSFEVCRKFHLTEGLCAMAALSEGFAEYRRDAQGFLEGQLDMLLLLGLILEEARGLTERGETAEDGSLIRELRETLVLGDYIENHCYYAGHIIELAAFAESLGYRVAPEHRAAMAFVANELNRSLPPYLADACFGECFLHLGHYRRAITLLPVLERLRAERGALTRADLARYTVDFDAYAPDAELISAAARQAYPRVPGVFEVATFEGGARAEFLSVVASYRSTSPPPHFEPRGAGEHFRRIGPPGWPRSVHYEFVDYGGPVGAELHLESDDVRPLAERVRPLVGRVAARLPGPRIEWEPKWSQGRGRLRVVFDASAAPEQVAAGMRALIEETFPELDAAARGVCCGTAAQSPAAE